MPDISARPSPLVAAIRFLDKLILAVTTWCGVLALTTMVVVILAGVVMRFILKVPNMWGEEISRYMMVWGIYLGMACGCRSKSHLAVTNFVDMLPAGLRRCTRLLFRLVVVAAYAVFTVLLLRLLLTQYSMGQKSPAMLMPMWIVYIGPVAGFALSFFFELLLFVNDFIFKGLAGREVEKATNAAS